MRVLCTSPWIPPEWIHAHGHHPVGVWALPDPSGGRQPLRAGVCAFADQVRCLAENTPDNATIFSTQCDQLRRSFDSSDPQSAGRAFLFNIPATHGTAAAERLFADELSRLSRFLVRLGGSRPSADRLGDTLVAQDRARKRLASLRTILPAHAFAEAIAQFCCEQDLPHHFPGASAESSSAHDIRIALIGGPLTRCHWPVLEFLEQQGARIVLLGTEPGERHLESPPLPQLKGGNELEDAWPALARAWLARCVDVFQRPNSRLYEWLGDRLQSRGVRGILLWQYVWCDLWRAEAQSLRDRFGLPVLPLDVDHGVAPDARTLGRIQAFLESLR